MCSFQSQGNTSKVYHPCYPSDFTDVFKLEEVFDSPCVASRRPKTYDPHSWIRVQGTGDYQSCLGNTSEIFYFHFCPFSQCSFNGVFQPNISGGFMVRGPEMPKMDHMSSKNSILCISLSFRPSLPISSLTVISSKVQG